MFTDEFTFDPQLNLEHALELAVPPKLDLSGLDPLPENWVDELIKMCPPTASVPDLEKHPSWKPL